MQIAVENPHKMPSIGDCVIIKKEGHRYKGHMGTVVKLINDNFQAIVQYNTNLNSNGSSVTGVFSYIDIAAVDNSCVTINFIYIDTYICSSLHANTGLSNSSFKAMTKDLICRHVIIQKIGHPLKGHRGTIVDTINNHSEAASGGFNIIVQDNNYNPNTPYSKNVFAYNEVVFADNM
jgi:hypothetical protein